MNRIVIIVMIMILLLCLFADTFQTETFDQNSKTWATSSTCYQITQIYSDILGKYNVKRTYGNNWTVFIPCSYNNPNTELRSITPNKNQLVFALKYADELVSKSTLWLHLLKYYKSRSNATKYAPLTYVLYKPSDLALFQKEYDGNKYYILKKNIQRQEGIKITNNKASIMSGFLSGYVVAQELLSKPFLINDRKINLRVYVLIVCQNNTLEAYVHNDGFMYYTKSEYKANSNDFSENITTGYIDRWVYNINPLTHTDFKKYLDNQEAGKSKRVFNNINKLLTNVLIALKEPLLKNPNEYKTFQLFGADVAISDDLQAYIIEFNKGPSLDCKDDRDCNVKKSVVTDVFDLLGIIQSHQNNNFVRLI